MKVLIATDLLVSMLLQKDYVDGIDILFMWFKKLNIERCMDVSSLMILTHFSETQNLSKLKGFYVLNGTPPKTENIAFLREQYCQNTKDKGNLTLLPNLAWLDNGDVDFVITENSTLLNLACKIAVDSRVYSIENFIEKCSIEHRNLDPMKGLVVKEVRMGKLSLEDEFFQSFIEDYRPYYFSWFRVKSLDNVYVSRDTKGNVKAILKLKVEYEDEDYSNIDPPFTPAKRLKISSFKVDYTGQKIGERFMRIIFSHALSNKVDEIYVTIFNNSKQKKRLINLLSYYGFSYYGKKDFYEDVYVKKMSPLYLLLERENFPFVKYQNSAFIIPIHPEYAKDLLPREDANLVKEDVEPYKSSIKKVISLYDDDLRIQKGTILMFYKKTKEYDESGIIAIGVVENVYRSIKTEQQYVLRCRKRSILDDDRLKCFWKRKDKGKSLVVVEFLYNCSFNDNTISESKIRQCKIDLTGVHLQVPFYVTKEQYKEIIEGTKYAKDIDFD